MADYIVQKYIRPLFNFIDEMHEKDVPYVIFRGFGKLPEIPDKDIDMVGSCERYSEVLEIESKHFVVNNNICAHKNHGFGEWCDMLLNPFFTSLEREEWLPDGNVGLGYFRIDLQNSLYFKSPYNNYQTDWTVPKKFNPRHAVFLKDENGDEQIVYYNRDQMKRERFKTTHKYKIAVKDGWFFI